MSYKFEYTEENGYEELKVPRKEINKILTNDTISFKRSLFIKRKVLFNSSKDEIVIYMLNTFLNKVLITLLLPPIVLLHGLVNLSDIIEEFKSHLREEKYGAFSQEIFYIYERFVSEEDSLKTLEGWTKKYSKTGGIK